MKKFGLFLAALLVVASPALAVVELVGDHTYQCWDFDDSTQIGIIGRGNNPYGTPAAIINDLSFGKDLDWSPNYGGWYGSDFMIMLDIPNSLNNDPGTYKLLTIEMFYMGDLATLWVLDPETRNFFNPVEGTLVTDEGEVWKYYKEQFRIEPNPRKEFIAIGLKGDTMSAAINQICISTVCIPEPMTLALLAAGGFFALRKKHRKS